MIPEKKPLDRKENNDSTDLPLYEQFTWQGFWAVSGWALAWLATCLPLSPFIANTPLIPFEGLWLRFLVTFLFIWLLCFLFMCLIPKLKGEK